MVHTADNTLQQTDHSKQVVISFDLSGHFGELLIEGVRDVVGRVRGDYEDTVSHLG